jgi:hypothetical protein
LHVIHRYVELTLRDNPSSPVARNIIEADYRLLVPSSGFDILADMSALFSYLLTLPIRHHQPFLAGFSGGGYPLRLATVLAAEEKRRDNPRFTVLGWVSFCGMGGDFLLDHWLTPRSSVTKQPLGPDHEPSETEQWTVNLEAWYETDTEFSDLPYTDGITGHIPSRLAKMVELVWAGHLLCSELL